LAKRQEALLCRSPLPDMRERVDALVPSRVLSVTPWDRLPHLSRYLQALLMRAGRAAVNPAKDREKVARIAPYERALGELVRRTDLDPGRVAAYRWLLVEYRVSIFAQESGTAQKVSPRILNEALEGLR
jgi:ATP-dependent helicase HrpA